MYRNSLDRPLAFFCLASWATASVVGDSARFLAVGRSLVQTGSTQMVSTQYVVWRDIVLTLLLQCGLFSLARGPVAHRRRY